MGFFTMFYHQNPSRRMYFKRERKNRKKKNEERIKQIFFDSTRKERWSGLLQVTDLLLSTFTQTQKTHTHSLPLSLCLSLSLSFSLVCVCMCVPLLTLCRFHTLSITHTHTHTHTHIPFCCIKICNKSVTQQNLSGIYHISSLKNNIP